MREVGDTSRPPTARPFSDQAIFISQRCLVRASGLVEKSPGACCSPGLGPRWPQHHFAQLQAEMVVFTDPPVHATMGDPLTMPVCQRGS